MLSADFNSTMRAKGFAQNEAGEWVKVSSSPLASVSNTQPEVSLVITGQIRGGKNNMIVTRTGMHFPKPEWAKWRDNAVAEIKRQLPPCFKPLDVPINMRLNYIAGDKRRRDMPAILDSIFHVVERAGVVTDDSLIWVVESSRSYDKEHPMAIMYLTATKQENKK
jgi:crossover junction endodeoxyribonuclease RusA